MNLKNTALSALSALALLASCSQLLPGKASTSPTKVANGAKSATISITIKKPDYAAMAASLASKSKALAGGASSAKAASRIVDPGSAYFDLYIVTEADWNTAGEIAMPDASYKVGRAPLTTDGLGDTATLSFDVAPDLYHVIYFEILASDGSMVLTYGQLVAGDINAATGLAWDGTLVSGHNAISMSGRPTEVLNVTTVSDVTNNVTVATLAPGELRYLSFPLPAGTYQFSCIDGTGGNPALFVLYDAAGRKNAGNFSALSQNPNDPAVAWEGVLTANYASTGSNPPYLAIYNPSTTMTSTYLLFAIPVFPADGTDQSVAYENGNWGKNICFPVTGGTQYVVKFSGPSYTLGTNQRTIPHVFFDTTDAGFDLPMTADLSTSTIVTAPAGATMMYMYTYVFANENTCTYSAAEYAPSSITVGVD